MDISGTQKEVFGHRRCPNLLKMTKYIPSKTWTRSKDRFPSDFLTFFAVSAKAPAGKQRSVCGDPENGHFRRYSCPKTAFQGYLFPFFLMRWTFPATETRILGTAGAQNCWKWPKRFRFRQELGAKTVFRVILNRFSPFLPRRQPENSVLPVGTLKTGVFEGIFALR